jgi:hypothetical protein
MKTNEQIKQEVINYLEKTTKHVFLKPKSTYISSDKREYNYEEGEFFKLIKKEDGYYTFNSSFIKDKIRKFDVDNYIKIYGSNAKCVIKHTLFMDKKMKSIKNTKKVKLQIEELIKPVI